MKKFFATTDEIVKGQTAAPLNLSVIPNFMGINLCSVSGISWTEQPDGQLTELSVHFIPAQKAK